jgi:hypothetical protein
MSDPSAELRLIALRDGWVVTGDRRALFADCYRLMTQRMLEGLAAGGFHDPVWVARLLDRFADYYFEAVDAVEAHEVADPLDTCPAVWRVAFDACADPCCHPLQALLLGINAHINHDLALAVVDVLDDWPGLDEAARDARRADHTRVNDTIRATTDEVQREVVAAWAPSTAALDEWFGGIDEWVFAEVVEVFRDQVWDDAMRLLAVPVELRAEAADEIAGRAARTAAVIMLGRHPAPG